FTACAFVICPIVAGQVAVQSATTQAEALARDATQEQERATKRRPRRIPSPPARVTVIPSDPPIVPQVVTVVHRLSGVKVLRLLLSQGGETGGIETIDPETITNDAHASIIAGLVLDDGKTIAVRLPQAAAEMEFPKFDSSLPEEKARAAATKGVP